MIIITVIWRQTYALRTILYSEKYFFIYEKERATFNGYSYRLTAMVLLYAPSHRHDNTYHGLCYTSHGALAGTRNSSMGPPHEESIRRPTAPWANALPLSYVPLLFFIYIYMSACKSLSLYIYLPGHSLEEFF